MAITLNGTTGITTPAIDNQGNLTVSGALNTTGLSASTAGLLTVPSGASIYTVGSGTFGLNVAGELTIASGRDNGGDTIVKTSNTERMRIDGAGRVTMPYQPAFDVYNTTGNPAITGTSSVILPLNGVRTNVGGHYDTSTYKFTAPVSGMYQFNLNTNVYNVDSGQWFRHYFYLNGSPELLGSFRYSSSTGDQNISSSMAIYLVAQDYVSFFIQSSDSAYVLSSDSLWNRASGYLIG